MSYFEPWGTSKLAVNSLFPNNYPVVDAISYKIPHVLEGCRGIIEEVKDGKAQVLLVGGERRVRVNKQKTRTDVEVEPVEVPPPDFAQLGQQVSRPS